MKEQKQTFTFTCLKSIGVLCLIPVFWMNWGFSQNAVVANIDLGNIYSHTQLQNALANCNLIPYIKEAEQVTLKFDDGARVRLYTSQELIALNIPFNPLVINRTNLPQVNIFGVHADGYITESVQKLTKEELGELWNGQ